MQEDKIESVTFYKQIYHSTQIYEKNITTGSLVAISLPRIKFLEKDGAYRPSWAVDHPSEKKVQIDPNAPQAQHRQYRKETHRRLMLKRGGYAITQFEQQVYDLFKQGYDYNEICEKLNKKPSAIGGAFGRFKAKTLANQKKK